MFLHAKDNKVSGIGANTRRTDIGGAGFFSVSVVQGETVGDEEEQLGVQDNGEGAGMAGSKVKYVDRIILGGIGVPNKFESRFIFFTRSSFSSNNCPDD